MEHLSKLPPPISIIGVHIFWIMLDFTHRFIKDFFKIAYSLSKLLEKEIVFAFDNVYMEAFPCLKEKLISASIIIEPNWKFSFELMCDANGVGLDVVLG